MRLLGEGEKIVSECAGRINRQAITQRRPFGRLPASKFKRKRLPLSGLVRGGDGNALESLPEILIFWSNFARGWLEKLSQREKQGLPRKGLANVAAELGLQLVL